MTKQTVRVREFLAQTTGRVTKCMTCRGNLGLLADIAAFAELRQKRETVVAWMFFHKHSLVPNGYTQTYDALMRHVRRCLKGRGVA